MKNNIHLTQSKNHSAQATEQEDHQQMDPTPSLEEEQDKPEIVVQANQELIDIQDKQEKATENTG